MSKYIKKGEQEAGNESGGMPEGEQTTGDNIAIDIDGENKGEPEFLPDNTSGAGIGIDELGLRDAGTPETFFDMGEFKTDRFIVKYKNPGSESKLSGALHSRLEATKKLVNKGDGDIQVIYTNTRMKKEDLLNEIKSKRIEDEILYIQPDYEMTMASLDPYYDLQWGLYNNSEYIKKNTESKENSETLNSVQQLGMVYEAADSTAKNLPVIDREKADGLGLPAGDENDPAYRDALKELEKRLLQNEGSFSDLAISGEDSSELRKDETIETQPFRVDANVPGAWEHAEGNGVIVAVIDTGIDITHEDLEGNIWTNIAEILGNGIDDDGNGYIDDVVGWDFANDSNEVHRQDLIHDEWHGTHIAGIIAAQKDNENGIAGVAPEAQIMPLKVFKNGVAYTSDIIEAIQYAERMGAKIVNCSWGTTSYNQALEEAMNSSGMLFVCAAGNSYKNIDSNPVYPAAFNSSNIISVASIDRSGTLSGFSNYGENAVDVAAPGEDILSTLPDNQYNTTSGTSMASAFVAGEAALIQSNFGEMAASEVKEKIMTTSDRLSSLVGRVYNGYKINCSNVLNNVSSNGVIEIPLEEINYDGSHIELTGEGYNLYADGYWTTAAAMPTARYNFAATELNGKIYAIGGYNNGTFFTNVEVYDPVANTWTVKAPLPTARQGHGAAAVNGKIYVIGGYGTAGYLDTVEEYDPVTNTWTAKASMPTSRQGIGAAQLNGKIYAIGGYNASGFLNTVEEYDPMTNIWTTKASMNIARASAGVAVSGGNIYVVGGHVIGIPKSALEVYDSDTNTWTIKTSMPTSRFALGATAINGKVYTIGGYAHPLPDITGCMEVYDISTDMWYTSTSMPTHRYSLGVVSTNNKIYAIGGSDISCLNIVEVFTPALSGDYGDDIGSATSIQVGDDISGAIDFAGDVDFFKFLPQTSGTYNIYTMSSIDTYGHLYDESGIQLSYNDDAGEKVNFNINYNLTANQTYYIKVRHYNTVTTGAYILRVDKLNPITITASALTGYQVSLSWPAVSGAMGYTLEVDNAVIEVGTSTSYIHTGLAPSTSHFYRVRVKNALGSSNGSEFFTKSDDHGDNSSTATYMAVESERAGNINYGGDVDYFGFTPSQNGSYDIFTVSTIDTYGYLYNSSGTQLAYNDDYDGSTNFHMIVNLQAGQTYYVRVRHYNSTATGSYKLRIAKELPAISSISVTPTKDTITLTWDRQTGSTGYDIEVDGVIQDRGSSTTYVHSSLTPNIVHAYRVRSKNSINTSRWSEKNFSVVQGSSISFRKSMTLARQNFGTAVLAGKIYSIGGYNSSNGYLNKVEIYDPVSDTWGAKANIATARQYIGTATVNGKIYAIGGYNGSVFNSVEEYDPALNTWLSKASMPTARYGQGVVSANGKVYAIGGRNGSSYLNTVEEYNPVSNTWSSKAAMPTARYLFGTAVVNGKIYVIGGYNSNGYLNIVEEYDPIADSWTTKASIPMSCYNFTAVEYKNKIYILGGYNGNYLNSIYFYDPISDSWSFSAEMPLVISGHSAQAVNGTIYILGGYNPSHGYLNTVQAYALNKEEGILDFAVNASNAQNLMGKTFTIQYNPNEVELIDLASQTQPREKSTGNIQGTDINTIQQTSGIIKFKVNKAIVPGKTWTGVLNIIRFKVRPGFLGQPQINLIVE